MLRSPQSVADALAHDRGDLTLLHHTADLTIVNAVWAPGMTLYPHDHRMWAAIGIMAALAERARTGEGSRVEAALVDSGFTLMCHQLMNVLATATVA